MKKTIFITFILLGIFTTSLALAAEDYQSVKGIIKENCRGTVYEDSFLKGFDCTGLKKEIYYIKNKEVTKVEFETKKEIYDLKGEICKVTEKSKPGDLPENFSYSCTKGKYGTYTIDGTKVSFKNYKETLLGLLLSEMDKENNKIILTQLNADKKAMKSIKTFTKVLLSPEGGYSFSGGMYPIVGSACMGNTEVFTINGNGHKNLICEEGSVASVDHYLKDKRVPSQTYIKSIYKTLKDGNTKALKELKEPK